MSPPRPTTHHSVVPDYGIRTYFNLFFPSELGVDWPVDVDEGGDETGSSTDTDSD